VAWWVGSSGIGYGSCSGLAVFWGGFELRRIQLNEPGFSCFRHHYYSLLIPSRREYSLKLIVEVKLCILRSCYPRPGPHSPGLAKVLRKVQTHSNNTTISLKLALDILVGFHVSSNTCSLLGTLQRRNPPQSHHFGFFINPNSWVHGLLDVLCILQVT
jgi:hypothetical protein